jgi:hypothetical protein
VLNLVLTGVLLFYLVQTDPLALVLSVAWILLGVVAYYGLARLRSPGPVEEDVTDADEDAVPAEDD